MTRRQPNEKAPYGEVRPINRAIQYNNGIDFLISVVEYTISFLTIILTGSVWSRIEGSYLAGIEPMIHFTVSVMILFLAAIYAIKNGVLIKKNHMVWIIVSALFIILTLYKNAGNISGAIRVLYLPIISSLLLAAFMQPMDFWRLINRFIRLMFILAIISFFFWLFGSVLKLIPASGIVTFYWDRSMTANSFYGLYFEPKWQQMIIPGYGTLQKNCGVFAETPMFCYLLSSAYILYRLQPDQKKWLRILILATIISTVNTTALVAVIVFEIIKFAFGKRINSGKDVLKIIVLPVLGLIGFYAISSLIETKLSSGSGSIRIDHLQSCTKAFLSTFPFGTGIASHNAIVGLGEYSQGMSMGLPYFFAQGGLAAVVLTLVPSAYLLVIAISKKNWDVTAFLTAFLWSLFCTEVIYRCHFHWILINYFFVWGTTIKTSTSLAGVGNDKKTRGRIRIFGRVVTVGKKPQ